MSIRKCLYVSVHFCYCERSPHGKAQHENFSVLFVPTSFKLFTIFGVILHLTWYRTRNMERPSCIKSDSVIPQTSEWRVPVYTSKQKHVCICYVPLFTGLYSWNDQWDLLYLLLLRNRCTILLKFPDYWQILTIPGYAHTFKDHRRVITCSGKQNSCWGCIVSRVWRFLFQKSLHPFKSEV